jgi:flagellar protein FlgJ
MHAAGLEHAVPAAPPLDRMPRDVKEATQGFEALFLTTLLEQVTRGSGEEGGLVGNGPGSEVLRGLVEQTLAEQISRSGGIGLAERLVKEFQGRGVVSGGRAVRERTES